MTPELAALRDRVMHWLRQQPDIVAVLLVGSLARDDGSADQWSDLDFLIYTATPDKYLQDTGWIHQFGEVWVMMTMMEGDLPEHLVLMEGALKLDLGIEPVDKLVELTKLAVLPHPHRRGYRVLYDRDGIAATLPHAPQESPPELLTQREFDAIVDAFWYGAVYVARQIRRRQLWTVKYRDWTLKESLMEMIAWHTRAINGPKTDTWHEGRFLLDWADEKTLVSLRGAFGHFDAADSWRALRATNALFRRLAIETAARFYLEYNRQLDAKTSAFIETLYNDDDINQKGDA